ncbi:MAG: 6-hydroxycyclohex-1-ene-1-carbonyl-CoA dehydrogenase [Planctomycetes bacterium]|nr:6-hydroxycyclohex-1-ene-1-carbonyl-CoA dehydrogenase [Planctomycetota bacterium]
MPAMKIHGYEMRAVRQPLVRAAREIDGPGKGEVLVRVVGCGVCHTDLGFLYEGVPVRHALPLVLGHEIAGVVVSEGEGVSGLSGKAVIVPAVIPCGACAICRRGRGDLCRKQVFPGNDVHGGFASHVVVPAQGLCVVPGGERDPAMLARLSVVADAVSTAYQAVLKSGLSNDDFAVSIGVGGVGNFAAQIAAARGARVLAIDVDDGRLGRMREHGAEWTLNVRGMGTDDIRKRVREIAKTFGLPQTEWKIFETSGTGAGQSAAWALLTYGAVLSVVGFHPGDVSVRLSNLMAFAARAEGTWGCLPEHFPAVLELVREGRIALDPFIEMHPMSELPQVLEQMNRHEITRRPVLLPDFEK